MRPTQILALIIALTALDANRPKLQGDAGQVEVRTVRAEDVTVARRYACRLEAGRRVEVRAPAAGRLAATPIGAGRPVRRGDLLFQVGPLPGPDRPAPGAHDPLVSIEAAFDGRVDGPLRRAGDLVAAGEILATLADASVMHAFFQVPEIDYLDLMAAYPGQEPSPTIELLLADQSRFPQPGKLGAILATFGTETGDISFRGDFPDPDGRLRHGQRGTVVLDLRLRGALIVPRHAIGADAAGRYVYVVDRDEVVRRREIAVRCEWADRAVVGMGIRAGDRVVVAGLERVHDGGKLR